MLLVFYSLQYVLSFYILQFLSLIHILNVEIGCHLEFLCCNTGCDIDLDFKNCSINSRKFVIVISDYTSQNKLMKSARIQLSSLGH